MVAWWSSGRLQQSRCAINTCPVDGQDEKEIEVSERHFDTDQKVGGARAALHAHAKWAGLRINDGKGHTRTGAL